MAPDQQRLTNRQSKAIAKASRDISQRQSKATAPSQWGCYPKPKPGYGPRPIAKKGKERQSMAKNPKSKYLEYQRMQQI